MTEWYRRDDWAHRVLALCIAVLGACGSDPSDLEDESSPVDRLLRDGPQAIHFDLPQDGSTLPQVQLDLEREGLGAVTQAVVNGSPFLGAPHGVVPIWAWVTMYNEWRQICTATLVHNSVILTALHCLNEPGIEPNLFVVTLDGQERLLVGGEAAPGGLDVALMVMHEPMSIHGSTTGYFRGLLNASAGQSAYAMGYGWSATSAVPSAWCNSGTKGCLADPRSFLISPHITGWDAGRTDGTQLFVQVNGSGQQPYSGDSGSALLPIAHPTNDLSTRPVLGVLARRFDLNGVSSHAYTPSQHFRSWYCGIFGC